MTPAIVLVVLAVGLFGASVRLRLPGLAGAGLLSLALATGVLILLLHGPARAVAGIPAAALLLCAGELSLGLADGVGADAPGARRRQVAWLCGCAVSAAAIAFVVLGADAIGFRRSAVATIAGAALAGFAMWLLVFAVQAHVGDD